MPSSPQARPAPRSLDQLEQKDLSGLLSSIEEGPPAELVTEVQQRLGLSSGSAARTQKELRKVTAEYSRR